MSKPRPRIGVDQLYYAKVLSDTSEGTIYSAPVWMQGVNAIGYNPNTQAGSYDADDGTYESYSADGEIQTTVTVADLTPQIYADVMGLQRDANGMVIEGESDNAPEVALGFRSQKSNGAYRFIWILKGKFSKQQEDYSTKGGSGVTYQGKTIMHTALKRTSDGERRHILDSDDPLNTLTLKQLSSPEDGWFSSPNFTVAGYVNAATPISDLVATSGAAAGQITLAWTAATGASNVAVQVSQGSDWITVDNKAAADSAATLTGLQAGKDYLVRLYVTGGAKAGISNVSAAKAGAGS